MTIVALLFIFLFFIFFIKNENLILQYERLDCNY